MPLTKDEKKEIMEIFVDMISLIRTHVHGPFGVDTNLDEKVLKKLEAKIEFFEVVL